MASDHGGEGYLDPAWSSAIIEQLSRNPGDAMVYMCYPGWLSFLNHRKVNENISALNLQELGLEKKAAESAPLLRWFRGQTYNSSAQRCFLVDVLTAVELFRACAAWRDETVKSDLYSRQGISCVGWVHEVACTSAPSIWIVTDPELPLTLMSDRPGLYEALEGIRRAGMWNNSTQIVRDAQDLTVEECLTLTYPEGLTG